MTELILGMLEKFKVSKLLTFRKSFAILHNNCLGTFYLKFHFAILWHELI